MGRLLIGRKAQYNLGKNATEIPIRNGMFVTLDFTGDCQITNAIIKFAAKSKKIEYKELCKIVFDDNNYIKEEVYNESKVKENIIKNFNEKLDLILREEKTNIDIANKETIKKALVEMERDYRYDIRLLYYFLCRNILSDYIIEYYNEYKCNTMEIFY